MTEGGETEIIHEEGGEAVTTTHTTEGGKGTTINEGTGGETVIEHDAVTSGGNLTSNATHEVVYEIDHGSELNTDHAGWSDLDTL